MIVNEIFTSISGEVGIFPQGSPVVFVRLAGCNLQCAYCDTPTTQVSTCGIAMSVDEVIQKIMETWHYGMGVVLTGGEPLLHPANELVELINKLGRYNCRVQIETNGTKDWRPILRELDLWAPLPCLVVDYKLRSSFGEREPNRLPLEFLRENLPHTSWVKMVVHEGRDFNEVLEALPDLHAGPCDPRIAVSCTSDGIHEPAERLGLWYQQHQEEINRYGVTLNLQIHKILNLA